MRGGNGVGLDKIRDLIRCAVELAGERPLSSGELRELASLLVEHRSLHLRVRDRGDACLGELRSGVPLECRDGGDACLGELKTIVEKLLGSDEASLALCLDSYVPPDGQRAVLVLVPFLAYPNHRAPEFFWSLAVSVDCVPNVDSCECVERRECAGTVRIELTVGSS